MMRENLKTILETLPKVPGVYYIYNSEGNIIYIGKSINIRKRLQQHFTNTDTKSVKIQNLASAVSYETTGSELIALLRESELIKQYKPLFNRAQRHSQYFWGIYLEETPQGYLALKIQKIQNEKKEITSFVSMKQAKEELFRITEKYQLCQKINGLYKTKSQCFHYTIKECLGACINKEPANEYNKRVQLYLSQNSFPEKSILIELPGRESKEKGLVLIENGVYKGFGYCSGKKSQTNLKKFIEPKQDNKDVRRLLRSYLRKNGFF